MSSEASSEIHWYTPVSISLILLIFLIVGPTVLVPAWFVRGFASQVPVWDPDQRWDGVKGYAIVGCLVYAFLAVRLLLFPHGQLDLVFSHIMQQVLTTTFDLSLPALIEHWSAGLLLTGIFALQLEREQPRTDRFPLRMLTPSEEQLLEEREVERKRRERERQRLEEAEKQRQAEAAETERKRQAASREAMALRAANAANTTPMTDPAKQAQPTQPSNPLAATGTAQCGEISAEERARNQFLTDQAATLRAKGQPTVQASTEPLKPAEKPKKQDKGDGSMEDLL